MLNAKHKTLDVGHCILHIDIGRAQGSAPTNANFYSKLILCNLKNGIIQWLCDLLYELY